MPRKRLSAARGSDDPIPLHYRLRSLLRSAIDSGQYSIGGSLPPERELGEIYGVSRITVRHAIEALAQDGLLRRVRGRNGGTFVQSRSRKRDSADLDLLDRVATREQSDRTKVLAFDMRRCETEIADLLRIGRHEQIRYVERVMATVDGPFAHLRTFVPGPVGRALQQRDLDRAFIRHLVQEHGMKIARVQDEVEACLADSEIAVHLGVGAGSPLLRMTRRFYSKSGRCRYLTLLLVGSNYRLSITLPKRLPE